MATDSLTEPRVTDDAASPIYAEKGIGHGATTRDPTRITWQHISRFLAGDFRHYFIGSRKPLHRQIGEMIKLSLTYKYVPHHYIKHQLFRGSCDENIFDFLPPKLVERLRNKANMAGDLRLTVDKMAFHQWCKDNNIPTPATRPFSELADLCHGSLERGAGKYFVKPRFGGSGSNVGRLLTLGDEFLLFSRFYRAADASQVAARVGAGEDFIIQDYVRQHKKINALFAGSVNTVRVETIDTGTKIIVNSALLRIGSGRSTADNWSTGGLIVNIDLQTGRTVGPARTQLKDGGQAFAKHPDTNAPLSGIEIPYWNEVRQMCERAASQMRPFKMLGWDVAITDDGPLIIEVNEDYHIGMSQEACRGLGKTYWGMFFQTGANAAA